MRVTIIVDASFCNQTGAGGYGFWIASERGKEPGGGPLKGRISNNNAAEMMGVCNALYRSLINELVLPGDQILMQTDCVAAIQGFEGRRNLTDPQEKEALRTFRSLRSKHDLHVYFKHVKGHTRREEARYVTNNLCDQRAKQGMRQARLQLREGTENAE